jgi:hypothetical protein
MRNIRAGTASADTIAAMSRRGRTLTTPMTAERSAAITREGLERQRRVAEAGGHRNLSPGELWGTTTNSLSLSPI